MQNDLEVVIKHLKQFIYLLGGLAFSLLTLGSGEKKRNNIILKGFPVNKKEA